MYRFSTMALALALVPFALALSIDLHVVVSKLKAIGAGTVAGLAMTLIALGLWYAVALFDKRRGIDRSERKPMQMDSQRQGGAETEKLKDKIEQVLQEAPMVIPGASATLGILPVGTMKNLACALCIPAQIEPACELLRTGSVHRIGFG